VFVVKRAEQRNDNAAPELALKVPEYDGSAARFLSQDEFLALFRKEAGALLAVAPHENLASLVTFDGAARPKPILVMELVKGTTLERALAKGDMDCMRAFATLSGVAAGLACMHAVGVGHLDLKPANIVLRQRDPGLLARQDARIDGVREPVLVDYGLSGRHVRPGCGSGSSGAPEIWETGTTSAAEAAPADMYALGCLAFEILTGQPLFSAATEAALVAEHLSHDGRPPRLVALAEDPSTLALAECIASCLRRDPAERASAAQFARELPLLALNLRERSWPLLLSGDVAF
jgi:serine/threonine protein kinase